MKRRTLAPLVLILALLLPLLAGCGPTETQAPTEPPAPTEAADAQPSDTPTPAPAPTDTAAPADTPTPTPVPTEPVLTEGFYERACAMQLPEGVTEGENIKCGTLYVPEDRADPDSRTLQLAVAILHPEGGATLEDPIVYLEGGPGGSSLELLYLTYKSLYAPVLAAGRDIILFDQRGVGMSQPALDCPEAVELGIELLDNEKDGETLTRPEMAGLNRDTLQACGKDLAAEADLSDYHTVASSADVADLVQALGYEQVNLWGISYGTRLALGVMRDHPEIVRSAVLDSVVPPDADLYVDTPDNVARALDTLLAGCAAEEACQAAYPDLETVLFDTVKALNDTPAPFTATNPLTGETYDALLDGDSLLSLVFQFMYDSDVIPNLPKLVYDVQAGRLELAGLLLGALIAQREAVSDGMQLSVQCHEELAFSTPEAFTAALERNPELAGMFDTSQSGGMVYDLCAGWGAGQAAAAENEPVVSDLPALVLSGEYDPITPPTWGERVAETLSQGHWFEFPGLGHGATRAECPRQMMLAFLEDPSAAPDAACRDEMAGPKWVVAMQPGEIAWVPFTSEAFGIQGIVPDGWAEISQGVYSRGSSALDVTILLEQAAEIAAKDLLNLLLSQLGLAAAPEPAGTREANGLTWTLYSMTVQSIPVDLALAESEGLALLVMLQSDPGEREAMYEAVFLPAVDALVPLP